MFKRLLIAAIVVALFLGGVAYFQLVFKPAMIADFVSKMAPPAATVTAEPAKTETWTAKVYSIGTLVAIEGVEVAPQLGGTVMDYFFDSGKEVKQGEKLVQIDISVEEADLVSAKATLLEAELDLERKASLVRKDAVSQAILDAATAKRDSAAASVERIEAIIAQKTITAPFSGKLGLRRVEKGQYVSPGQALVWLQSLDPIWVDFPVPESEVAKFKIGSKIELTVDSYPGQMFKGEVTALDARLSQEARTLMVRGTLPNPDRKLLPGMFANTAVLAGEPRELVTVPRTALTYSLYGDSVWVVKQASPEKTAPSTSSAEGSGAAIAADAPDQGPKLTAERRFVRVGQVEEGRIAVIEGLKAGEQVITSGQLKLQNGAAIQVNNADALKPPAELPRQ